MGNKEVPQSPEQHPQRQGWYMQRWSHSEGGWTDSYYFQEVYPCLSRHSSCNG